MGAANGWNRAVVPKNVSRFSSSLIGALTRRRFPMWRCSFNASFLWPAWRRTFRSFRRGFRIHSSGRRGSGRLLRRFWRRVAPAPFFFPIHLRVGETQQGIRPVSVERPDGDTDTRTDRKPLVVRADGLAQRLRDLICNLFGVLSPAEQRQQHHKLIATKARDRIPAAHGMGHALGSFLQNHIPGVVTICIVDLFEAVEVYIQHAQ